MSSGFPGSDAQADFSRARRARLLADIGRRLRREPDDVALILPFEEVVEALGRTGQHDVGLQVVPLDAIVGTVDRAVDFDRGLRPTSAAPAQPLGADRFRPAPRRVAPACVAVTRSATSTSCATATTACRWRSRSAARTSTPTSRRSPRDCAWARTRGSPTCRSRTTSGCSASACRSRPRRGADLRQRPLALRHAVGGRRGLGVPRDAEPRHLHGPRRGRRHWFAEEYEPVVELLRAGRPDRTRRDGDRGVHALAADRYRVLRTHEWSDEVLEELRREERRRRRRRRRAARVASASRSLRSRLLRPVSRGEQLHVRQLRASCSISVRRRWPCCSASTGGRRSAGRRRAREVLHAGVLGQSLELGRTGPPGASMSK